MVEIEGIIVPPEIQQPPCSDKGDLSGEEDTITKVRGLGVIQA
jgi:hypothetical protein